jgi:hypothetical protein
VLALAADDQAPGVALVGGGDDAWRRVDHDHVDGDDLDDVYAVQDRCAWTAGAIPSWTVTSFVTRGASRVAQRAGPGEQAWDGGGAAPGAYRLRVLYAEPGSGRVVLTVSTLVLDLDPRGSPTPPPPPTPSSPGRRAATGTPPPSP